MSTASHGDLLAEMAELRTRLAESEETLRAIRSGEVDALVVEAAHGTQIYVLQDTDVEANRFRSDILAKVSEAIIALDDHHHVIYLNHAAELQYGATSGEILGRPVSELYENRWLKSDDADEAARLLERDGHWRGRRIHVTRNGGILHVESSISQLTGKDGIAAGLLEVVRDITAAHRADETIRANASQLRLIADTAPVLITHCDCEHRFKFVNHPYATRFGFKPEDLIGKKIVDVIGSSAYESIRPYIEKVLTGEPVEFEISIPYEKLGPREMGAAYAPERDATGAVVGFVGVIADITERKRVENAIRESENFNRGIVESSRDCIKVLDLEGRLISMSKRGQKILRIDDFAPFVGQSWIDLWEGVDREVARAAVAKARNGGSGSMIGLTRTLWNEPKWFDVAVSPIDDASGKPMRLLAVSRDITDRRRAELDARFLAEVTQELSNLTDTAQIMEVVGARLGTHFELSLCNFVHINDDGEIAEVAHAWHRPDVPSSIGVYHIADYMSSDYQETLRAGRPFVVRDTDTDPRTNSERFAALRMKSFVCMPLVRDGGWQFTLNIHHSEAHDWQLGEIELTREIVARIWARLERLRIESELHESEARFRLMADAITQLAWIAHADGHLFWYNQRWYDYTGCTPEEMEGWGWQKVHHPDELPKVMDRWQKTLATGEPFDMTFPLRGADGIYREFLTRGIPQKDAEGKVVRWFGTNTDVSELKRIEAELADHVAELAQADRNKDEFLAMLAHELRNPLAPLRNATAILQDGKSRDAQRQRAQQLITRQIENMSRMIDDLLDVSRITQGKIVLRREPVALAAILTAAVDVLRDSCANNRQELTLVLPEESIYLDADATRLEQVFGNLLGNACKYSGHGSHIVLEAVLDAPDEVTVRVKDDGAGIDPELLPRIFDLFVQSSRTLDRSHGGLGIGLTIVSRLVKLHGGTISAHSEGDGNGSEFVVRLPVIAAPAQSLTMDTALYAERPRRMLIVDDNMDAAETMAMWQELRGHETRVAHTGPDALAIAAEFLPEVVLLDIGLPGMDGFEVGRKLRENPRLADAFLVALTGYGSDQDRQHAKEAGFNELMAKPADLDLLRRWLAER